MAGRRLFLQSLETAQAAFGCSVGFVARGDEMLPLELRPWMALAPVSIAANLTANAQDSQGLPDQRLTKDPWACLPDESDRPAVHSFEEARSVKRLCSNR